jgi:adenosine deaminase
MVRLVLLVNRNSSPEFIEECEDAIAVGLPGSFVGVDLAGDEKRFTDVRGFESFFRMARSKGLGVTVHAGEFGDVDSIWRAIDQLGANRIGHGTSAAGCRQLAARLSTDRILVEISVTSNVALGAVSSLDKHPLLWFIKNGVPVCLNTDIPIHLGTNFCMERRAAAILVNNDQWILDEMERSASRHAFGSGPSRKNRG